MIHPVLGCYMFFCLSNPLMSLSHSPAITQSSNDDSASLICTCTHRCNFSCQHWYLYFFLMSIKWTCCIKFRMTAALQLFHNHMHQKCCGMYSTLKAQSHLDLWRERVNTVSENHKHVQNGMCAPVNHPPTCPKCMSNILKLTAHRVDTVLVTFPKRFHTMCECVAACQWSIHHVPDVYVTCKYRAQWVSSDHPAVFYHAISMRPPYIQPLWHHDDSIKAPSPAFSLSGINSQC